MLNYCAILVCIIHKCDPRLNKTTWWAVDGPMHLALVFWTMNVCVALFQIILMPFKEVGFRILDW
jgi:hypothetical protein